MKRSEYEALKDEERTLRGLLDDIDLTPTERLELTEELAEVSDERHCFENGL